jgi:hypothetical protein
MATELYRSPVFQARRRKSRIAGLWGFNWLHANEWGGAVLRGKSGLRTVCGVAIRTPSHVVVFMFRRRELKL